MLENNKRLVKKADKDAPSDGSADSEEITLVGIGASAGGLAALKQLFAELSPDTGFAYVVVMHLMPDRKSSLTELLQHVTPMPITQVAEEKVLVQRNHVYIIPPNRNLSASDGYLATSPLEKDRADRAAIDYLLSSLAENYQERAIGIILSGTGSDGSKGLEKIKANAGITLVQDPEEAEFNAMPENAIATGHVDFIEPIKKLAKRLKLLAQINPQVTLTESLDDLREEEQRLLEKILIQVEVHCQHDFSRYKVSTILRRIRRRMQLQGIELLSEYLHLLRTGQNECHHLFDDLLITVTNFFRDKDVFKVIENAVIPALFKGKEKGDAVRVWVNGCSTGEEAYSLAMLLDEYASTLAAPPIIQIFASDLHEKSLNKGRDGRYDEQIAKYVSPERLVKYFSHYSGKGYQVRQHLREMVVFAPHNLLSDPPFSRLDMITCRNVMIYFQRQLQEEVLDIFHYALKPGGYLILGSSETLSRNGLFSSIDKRYSIHRKVNVNSTNSLPTPKTSMRRRQQPVVKVGEKHPVFESYGHMHHRMVELYGPPSLLTTREFEIVHFSANAGRYLIQPGGEPTNNLFKRIIDDLKVEMRATLFSAKKTNGKAHSKPLVLTIGGRTSRVVIHVKTPEDQSFNEFILILFEELEYTRPENLEKAQNADQINLIELESELNVTKKRIQDLVEEYENSQEQMRSSNEELQTANEELRSTLEELETSKEELQSMNEELVTANQENKHRVEELSELSNDLQNLLAATDIATLFLDRQLRILRFTPRLNDLFNLIESDKGRPISDFTHRLGHSNLAADAKLVLDKLKPFEREIQSENDRWYLLRINPYRSDNDRIDGVVITLVDISELKRAEEQLRLLKEGLESRVAASTQEVRQLASKLALAEQAERSRIGQVLHDDLQQRIHSVHMRMFMLFQELNISKEHYREFSDELTSAIELVRDISVDLSPPVLNSEGLKESLQCLRNQVKRLHNLDVTLNVESPFNVAEKDIRLLLFQIARELLFNVVKHANTQEATLELNREGNLLKMVVSDKGRGFDTNILHPNSDSSGFGLGSMHERLNLLGGTCKINSSLGNGTSIKITLPV